MSLEGIGIAAVALLAASVVFRGAACFCPRGGKKVRRSALGAAILIVMYCIVVFIVTKAAEGKSDGNLFSNLFKIFLLACLYIVNWLIEKLFKDTEKGGPE
jgi:Kef-type K+ transport system membrane component KefB